MDVKDIEAIHAAYVAQVIRATNAEAAKSQLEEKLKTMDGENYKLREKISHLEDGVKEQNKQIADLETKIRRSSDPK